MPQWRQPPTTFQGALGSLVAWGALDHETYLTGLPSCPVGAAAAVVCGQDARGSQGTSGDTLNTTALAEGPPSHPSGQAGGGLPSCSGQSLSFGVPSVEGDMVQIDPSLGAVSLRPARGLIRQDKTSQPGPASCRYLRPRLPPHPLQAAHPWGKPSSSRPSSPPCVGSQGVLQAGQHRLSAVSGTKQEVGGCCWRGPPTTEPQPEWARQEDARCRLQRQWGEGGSRTQRLVLVKASVVM